MAGIPKIPETLAAAAMMTVSGFAFTFGSRLAVRLSEAVGLSDKPKEEKKTPAPTPVEKKTIDPSEDL